MSTRIFAVTGAALALCLQSLLSGCAAPSAAFDRIVDSTQTLSAPRGREVSMRVLYPAPRCQHCGVIVFSHGAYASPARYDALLTAWAKGGWVVVAPLHVDSEDHPDRANYEQSESLRLRLEDYDLAVASYGGKTPTMILPGVETSGDVIAAGHSYGALIAQIAGGARLDGSFTAASTRAPLPLAVVAISPPGPIPNYVSSAGWSQIKVPQLVISGTTDIVPGIAPEWNLHMASYEAAPAGKAYALVFDRMDHYFNGAYGRLQPIDASTELAVQKLNAEILRFAKAMHDRDPAMADQWIANSSAGVKAIAR
ncbi:MAG: alpha/beta hydrolase [Steroidobacteraceae bacterium]|nr:alpha/beta hydrolase [Steroidobacteraceae bacterium]